MSENKVPISVITCDMEGRIETFNKGAEEIFGYTADEVIDKKRVSLFSPGLVVLGYVPMWLDEASKKGEYSTETTFVRKDGSQLAASVKITPTMKDGVQIGYCGTTTPLPDKSPEETMPPTAFATKIISVVAITRIPFLTATWIPILAAAAWANSAELGIDMLNFWIAFLAGSMLHLAANTYNDYFDWTSGTDQENNDYFLQLSGGSRAIELGLISEQGLFKLANTFLALSAVMGVGIMYLLGSGGYELAYYGIFGAFSAYFYTGMPFRLVSRRGIGELLIGLNFGPVMTMGTVFAITGVHNWDAFMIGIPLGLLTTAILWINQFPDMESDIKSGKNHLVATIGLKNASYGYLALMIAAFGSLILLNQEGYVEKSGLLMLLATPIAAFASFKALTEYDKRELAIANWATIGIHFVAGALFSLGLYYNINLF